MNKKYITLPVLLAFLLLHCISGKTQSSLDATPVAVVPPSPVASSLFKDVNVPVNYYTGTPNISIPIHTIKIGALQMPITLKYTATGIKVEQESGWVGLGWDLQTGGAIGRSIVGVPDEQDMNGGGAGYRTTAAYLQMPEPGNDFAIQPWLGNLSSCTLQKLVKGSLELTPDNYFMNFNGNSAKLFFDKNGQPYFSPYKAWKLTGNETAGYTVITEDGTTYIFNLAESSNSSSETLPSDIITPNVTANTSWYLTSMISANKADTLTITYTPVNYSPIAYNPAESRYTLLHGQTTPACVGTPPASSSTITTSAADITGYIIKSISTRNQRVDFFASTGRKDIPDATTGMPYKLDSIRIYATSPYSPDQLLRKFTFNYDYFTDSPTEDYLNQRLMLLSVSESDSLNTTGQVFSLSYYGGATLPSKDSKAQDNWGYYNAARGNGTLIPSFTDDYGIKYPGADRSANPTFANIGLLQKIQYPTGGFTSFEYESNRYATNKPGTRDSISSAIILNTFTGPTGSTTPSTKTNTFTIPGPNGQYVDITTRITEPVGQVGEAELHIYDAAGNDAFFTSTIGLNTYTVLLDPGTYTAYAYKDAVTTQSAGITIDYTVNVPSPIPGLAAGGARISRMVQSDGRTSMINRFQYLADTITSSGRLLSRPLYTSITYSPQIASCQAIPYKVGNWLFYSQHSVSTVALGRTQGNYIGYTKVTVLHGDNGENGREELFYSFKGDQGGNGYPYAPETSYDDVRGSLLQHNTYDAGGRMVKAEQNQYNYNDVPGSVRFRQIFGAKTGFREQGISETIDGCPDLLHSNEWQAITESYRVCQFWPTLASTTTSTYSTATNDAVTVSTQTTYDSVNLQPVSRQTTSSNGDVLLTTFKYPGDFAGIAVYDSMIARNIITPVIESDEYNNGNLVSRKVANYQLLNNNYQTAVPQNIQVQNGANGPLETRLQFNKYDSRFNLVSQNKSDDAESIYLFGYQGVYPIAEVSNADSISVAYSSFEDGTTGNWTASGGSFSTAGGVTGSAAYTLSPGASLSRTGLNPSKTYLVTYWSQSEGAIVNGATGISGLVKNGWTFYQHRLSAGTTAVSITGYSTLIDEVRLYPADALMKTYTYSPLTGMTSSCAPNNLITYYEYDGLGRLLRIRDADKNILKQYYYQYQVPLPFYNVAQSGSFTRSNCSAGGAPGTVVYTVAAATYSSLLSQADADQQALNALNANGQNYANANGTCTFYNAAHSQHFIRSNCATGATPGLAFYTVPAGTFSSTVSQADADQQALNDIAANGQPYANANGTCTFHNAVQSQPFTRNNCAAGGTPGVATYTVPAGTYSSLISQADADRQAAADITANGQNYANANAVCTFLNAARIQQFTRNNCATGGAPGNVIYAVPAGIYTSTVSQADADQQALNDIAANGQNYANANGVCTFHNVAQSQPFTRNNCPAGGASGTATYTVPAGTYSSTVSQADADQKAAGDIAANGQNYANANGYCLFWNAARSGVFTRNNCPCAYAGTAVTYTVQSQRYSSFISQADADQQAINDIAANGQNYANANGTCTPAITCTGNSHKILNCACETGVLDVISKTTSGGKCITKYGYFFSDGTYTYDHTVTTTGACEQ
jgi:YD repeat-containing protein